MNVIGLRKIGSKEELKNLFKLSNIYIKLLKKDIKIDLTDADILDILKLKNRLLKQFKDEATKIKRSILKILVTCIEKSDKNFLHVCKLIIDEQVSTIQSRYTSNGSEMCVDWLSDLDILTCFASNSSEIYHLLENNTSLLNTPYNIIEAIISVIIAQSHQEIELSDTDVLFDDHPKDEDAKIQSRNKKYPALLLNLSECKIFRSKYS